MTASVRSLIEAARERLEDAPRERLGELRAPRRLLGIGPRPKIVPVRSAWHLGTLLLGDDAVFATGDIIRARAFVRRGYPAAAQLQRAELADAARRGGFAEGEIAHVGWHEIDVDAIGRATASDVVALQDGTPRIRWSAAGGWMPLGRYLDERVELLRHPPERA